MLRDVPQHVDTALMPPPRWILVPARSQGTRLTYLRCHVTHGPWECPEGKVEVIRSGLLCIERHDAVPITECP